MGGGSALTIIPPGGDCLLNPLKEKLARGEVVASMVEGVDMVLIGTNHLLADLGFLLAACTQRAKQVRDLQT